jgi:hypothetical protein
MSTNEQTLEERIAIMSRIAAWHIERAGEAEMAANDRDYRYHMQKAQHAYRQVDAMQREHAITATE